MTTTLVASLGPSLCIAIVNIMVSPTLGVALSTIFVSERSTIGIGLTITVSSSSSPLESSPGVESMSSSFDVQTCA